MRTALIQEEFQAVAKVNDVLIGNDLAARCYHPKPAETLPVLVFFHGGGWILNDLDTHDPLCRRIAHVADCVVLSVDYRRSPEHKYPAALDDAKAALAWVHVVADAIGGEPARIAVGGDSAGGTLAAALAKLARDDGGPQLRAQLLFYPVLDYSDPGTGSYAERGVGLSLDRAYMDWVWDAYLPSDWSRGDPYLFPLLGEVAGLPPTVLYIAEFDVLRDEGVAFAMKLRAAGVPVDIVIAEDQMHGFANHADRIAAAGALVDEASRRLGQWIRAAKSGPTESLILPNV